MTDITDTLAPTSDQLDAIDLHHSGPRTFTVERVVVNKSDQPVNIHLAEFPRVWRPGKNMRRVLADCWGVDSATWAGGRVTLYADMAVKFGNETPGGTRISHISGIDSVRKVPIILTRGKTALYPVKPLVEATPAAPPAPVAHLAAVEAAFTAAGIDQGRWLTYAATVLGRTVTAPTDLTEDDAHAVVAALQAELDRRDTAPTGGE